MTKEEFNARLKELNISIKDFSIIADIPYSTINNWGFTNVNEQNYEKFKLKQGDILIARTGNSIGVHFFVFFYMK